MKERKQRQEIIYVRKLARTFLEQSKGLSMGWLEMSVGLGHRDIRLEPLRKIAKAVLKFVKK